jgi:hypothetical protein
MAMSSRHFWIAVIASAALGGCNTVNSHYGDEDAAFGEAVKYDSAIQVVNPAPVYAANSAKPGSNGDVGASAAKRYRTDKVKAPQSEATSSGVGGGSGSGMSAGSGPQ